MNKVVAAAVLAACPSLAAQSDRIVWTDGTVTKDVRVTDFTWKEVTWTERGNESTRSADLVASIDCEKWADTYKRALAAGTASEAYDQYRLQLDKLTDKPFLQQYGFIEGARLLVGNAEYSEAFALLEKLRADCPNSGFLPDVFRFKLDYYLGLGAEGANNAKTVAKKYKDTAIQEGWPDGFVADANLYETMAKAAAGEATGSALQNELKGLVSRTESTYPDVASRARVQYGHALRAANELDTAREAYEEVLSKDGISERVMAQALVGLGYTHMATGDPSNTEPYRDAMLAFLRVYLAAPNAGKELRAEAVFNAAAAADKWRGDDASAMARRLRSYLRRDFADTSWAERRT